jgi:Sel1 repeat
MGHSTHSRLFGFGRGRNETDDLQKRVTALRKAVLQHRTAVRHAREIRGGLLTVIVLASLAVGFVLGVYNQPIRDRVRQTVGWVDEAEVPYLAYQRGKYVMALRRLRPLAERGDARAQSTLGLMYARAQGVPRDDVEAARWFRLAADQGNGEAQFNLGLMYAKGRGVPQDQAEAARWYRLAADRGHAQAQYDLGFLYATGEGMSQDYVNAHMWFNLAAAQFPASDIRNRRAAVVNREVLESKMSRDQISEAQTLAREWRAKRP